jgi:hypothetical protein
VQHWSARETEAIFFKIFYRFCVAVILGLPVNLPRLLKGGHLGSVQARRQLWPMAWYFCPQAPALKALKAVSAEAASIAW